MSRHYWFVRERLRIPKYVLTSIMIGGVGLTAVRTRVELVFALDAICATSSEGRPANATPFEVFMDGCTFGRDDQASSSRRRRRRNGVSGAARKVANEWRGERCKHASCRREAERRPERRSAITGCGADARGWLGRGRGEGEPRSFVDRDHECALACDFSCHVSGSEGIACLLD